GTFGFESYTLRERMTLVMRYSDKRVNEWFCDNGAEGALPDDWDSFKNDLIEFCAEECLESLHKFKEEKWSQFIERVLEFSKSREIDETIILKYLRKIPAPRDYQTLFFTSDLPLKKIIERIKEWETVKDKKQTFQKNVKREHKPKQVAGKKYKDVQVKCYKCNKMGHYANILHTLNLLKARICVIIKMMMAVWIGKLLKLMVQSILLILILVLVLI
ncbi:hypothetical protein DMUE_5981, partial [Dictyocoela muelleri]